MSKIRSKNTKPELLFRKSIMGKMYVTGLIRKSYLAKPDVSIQKYKLAIFIDGEFWHGYNWDERKATIKSNRAFWIPKIERNMQRDREVNQQLKAMDYAVFRFWEHEIKSNLKTCINDVLVYITTGQYGYSH